MMSLSGEGVNNSSALILHLGLKGILENFAQNNLRHLSMDDS
jgi:hypothetical protein